MIDIIVLEGNPIPLQRPRIYGKRAIDPQKMVKHGLQFIIKDQWRDEKLTCPVSLDIDFTMKIPESLSKKKKEAHLDQWHYKKPDLDNLVKFVLDILNGIVYLDDSQVVEIICKKRYGKCPQTKIQVNEITL